ncbi:uncharacterized protein [Diadema setosum]|uniref:uncharacterized protein n=1 Tax=Diadema setosum TaxID=31175 RepID=UPI003B3AB507
MQIFRDDLKIISVIEIQNDMINTVRGILKEFETGSIVTRGSSGSCMVHSSKTTDSRVQEKRIRTFCRSTKSRLNRLGERNGRHLRDKCELLIFQSLVQPQKSDPPELSINEESLCNISNKSQLRPEEVKGLYEHLELILTRNAGLREEERYHITQFILDAYEEDLKCQTANAHGNSLSPRYTIAQKDTPDGRIVGFWVEKIMNIGDSKIQYHVFTTICDYL